jgi:hypothetical protein
VNSKPDNLAPFNPKPVDDRIQRIRDQELDVAVSVYPGLDRDTALKLYRSDSADRARRLAAIEAEREQARLAKDAAIEAARQAAIDAEAAKTSTQLAADVVALHDNKARRSSIGFDRDMPMLRQEHDALVRLVLRLVDEHNGR